MSTDTKDLKEFATLMLAMMLAVFMVVAIPTFVVYVAYHFITKYW